MREADDRYSCAEAESIRQYLEPPSGATGGIVHNDGPLDKADLRPAASGQHDCPCALPEQHMPIAVAGRRSLSLAHLFEDSLNTFEEQLSAVAPLANRHHPEQTDQHRLRSDAAIFTVSPA